MGQDPGEIRQNIEETRQRMGDTVEALSYKTNVKARVGDAVSHKRDAILEKKDELVNRVVGAAPDPEDVKQNARQAASVAQENPLGLAIGSLAIGFLAGILIPSTSMEDERLGPMADQVKAQAADTAQDALEHGKQVAQDTLQAAAQTVQHSAQDHGQQLAETAKQDAQHTASAVKETAGT
jgi:gas vesicle protein